MEFSLKSWRRDARGQPYQLGRHDLKPVTRGWLEFIQRSIIPTSNQSKVRVKRAVMIHCIMLGNKVEVHQVILQELYRIATKVSTSARLPIPHLIFHMCEAARVHIDGDTPIEVDRPITRRGMEHVREHGHVPPQEPVPPPQQELPEMPQGVHFPSRDYWDQLTASIGS
ncbi:hypothetical protein AHAS_Ahas11G0182700 [Arachis hypogaea]